MKLMGMVKIGALIVVVAIVAAIAAMGFVFLDAMSYTATGSETLSPAGNMTGNALVVYDPGITGFAKDTAAKIAGDLQVKGYKVVLAGVRSSAASGPSGYDVVVAGGPTYAGNVSSSIKSYLHDLKPSPNARIGIFWTGGFPRTDDPSFLQTYVTELPGDVGPKVKSTVKLAKSDDVDKLCNDFVSKLIQ